MPEVPSDPTPIYGWVIKGAEGWMGFIEAMAKSGQPIPTHWLEELAKVQARLEGALDTLAKQHNR